MISQRWRWCWYCWDRLLKIGRHLGRFTFPGNNLPFRGDNGDGDGGGGEDYDDGDGDEGGGEDCDDGGNDDTYWMKLARDSSVGRLVQWDESHWASVGDVCHEPAQEVHDHDDKEEDDAYYEDNEVHDEFDLEDDD